MARSRVYFFPGFLLALLVMYALPPCAAARLPSSNPELPALSRACLEMLEVEGEDADSAFARVKRAGFIYDAAPRYFTITDRASQREYENSTTIKNIEEVVRSGLGGCGDICLQKRWDYFTGPLSLKGQPLLMPPKGAPPEQWLLTFLIAGSGHFHQGQTLLFPQRLLTKTELNTVTRHLRKAYPGTVRTRTVTPKLEAVDIVFAKKPEAWGWPQRISYYYGEVAPQAYQLIIEYTFDIT